MRYAHINLDQLSSVISPLYAAQKYDHISIELFYFSRGCYSFILPKYIQKTGGGMPLSREIADIQRLDACASGVRLTRSIASLSDRI